MDLFLEYAILGDLQKTNIGKKIYEKLNQNYKEYFI